jgi:acyl carrier protein phosphodiesterase
MNLLAHALLSGESSGRVVGGLAADVIRGPVSGDLPGDVAEGIRLHRRVDLFTDAHPVTARSRGRLREKWGRYSGILVDLAYDYCLAQSWAVYGREPMGDFVRRIYEYLPNYSAVLPSLAVEYFTHMIREDWLTSYGRWDGIGVALQRISSRLRRGGDLSPAVQDLRGVEPALREDFGEFFPSLVRYADESR